MDKVIGSSMEQINDWNNLRDSAHQHAVGHGFWEEEYPAEHYLCLIISELMESVEAHRKGMFADRDAFEKYNCRWGFEDNFRSHIKDTVEDELADTVIRILDLAGSRTIDMTINDFPTSPDIDFGGYYTENIFKIIDTLVVKGNSGLALSLTMCRSQICALADSMGIDLMWHINNKMLYNSFRGYKHGKKY